MASSPGGTGGQLAARGGAAASAADARNRPFPSGRGQVTGAEHVPHAAASVVVSTRRGTPGPVTPPPYGARMTGRAVLPVLLRGYDDAWERLAARVGGLTDEEYLWEPVRSAWSVRPGDTGEWLADGAVPDPDPAPVTTIAWRTWHLAADCLADHLSRSPAGRPAAARPRPGLARRGRTGAGRAGRGGDGLPDGDDRPGGGRDLAAVGPGLGAVRGSVLGRPAGARH
ncbi:DinB family protein, partial [Modestobacter roseus]|uniref:DinB family protein n=1 Tax=Modestobacter roseus TaxID=1181884 RepID=UPI0034E032E2